MDLNADGTLDILSGSYALKGTKPMAGTFHVHARAPGYGRVGSGAIEFDPANGGRPLVREHERAGLEQRLGRVRQQLQRLRLRQ